jgi:RHS repeat-associated protein
LRQLTSVTDAASDTAQFTYNYGELKLKNGTLYGFPANGTTPAASALVSITDRYSNQLTITRDATYNNITQITSPNGRWVQFTHDSSNRLTHASDDLGRTVTYTYDTCDTGFLCSVKDANGGTASYSYYTSSNPPPSGDGGLGNMSKIVDPRGNAQMTLIYDTNGRVKSQTLADGTSTFQFAYMLPGNVVTQTTITDPNGNVEQKSFDSNGFVTADIYAKGSTVAQTYSYTRDPNSERITAMTDPLGRQFSYGYDSFQRTNYLNQVMTLTNANLLSVTCSNCLAQSITTSMTYDPTFDQQTSVTDALNHTWSIGYDSRGNATSITDPLTHQVTLGYNFMGQLTSVTDAASDAVQLTYGYGDLAQITDPLGNVTKRFTDNAGRPISVADALGNLTQLAYDNLDHVTQISDANNGVTKFAYDAAENLLSLTDANTNVTAYTYDSRNRTITRKDALLISESHGYDGNSNLTSHTDRNGNVINYSYDALNRLSQAQYKIPGGVVQSSINYTWDGGNRVTQAVDSIAGTIGRQYNGLDRLTQESTPQGTVNYTYDAGRRSTMQVVGQTQVAYTWDNANRLTAISQGSQSVGLNYDNANRRTCLSLPNGVIAAYGYDKDSRVTSLTYGTGGSCSSPPSNLGNLTYTYDSDGRRTATAGSLAAVTLPANVTGGASTVYNADNAQTKFNGTALSYDANGNLTNDGTNTYTWDARNHLTAIGGGSAASFTYDGFGRRVKKVIGGTTTQFLYDGLNPVQELNGKHNAAVIANLLTGLGIDEYLTRTDISTGVTSTLLTDALGSTIGLVTANNGPIATNYTYQPFGVATTGGSVNGNPYEFTGRENDGTGLYFYRARYYSPTFQRFLAQDPIGFAGGDTNLYAYAENSPNFFTDPFGQNVITIGLGGAFRKGGELFGINFGPTRGGSGSISIAFSTPFGSAPGPWGVGIVTSRGHCGSYNGAYLGGGVPFSWSPVPYISNLGNSNQEVNVFDNPLVPWQIGVNGDGAGFGVGPGFLGGYGTEEEDPTVWWSTN